MFAHTSQVVGSMITGTEEFASLARRAHEFAGTGVRKVSFVYDDGAILERTLGFDSQTGGITLAGEGFATTLMPSELHASPLADMILGGRVFVKEP